jgi:hypothetical protein
MREIVLIYANNFKEAMFIYASTFLRLVKNINPNTGTNANSHIKIFI